MRRAHLLAGLVLTLGALGVAGAYSDMGYFLADTIRARTATNLVLMDANGATHLTIGTSGVTLGHTYWQDNVIPRWGTGQDATIQFRTYDTNDSMNFTTGATSYGGSGSANASAYFQFVPRAAAGGTESFDHPAGSHPTLAVHSTLDPTTDHSECSEWSYTGLLGGNAQSSYRMETDRAPSNFTVRAAGAQSGASTNTTGASLVLAGGAGSSTGSGASITLAGGVAAGGAAGSIAPATSSLLTTTGLTSPIVTSVGRWLGQDESGATIVAPSTQTYTLRSGLAAGTRYSFFTDSATSDVTVQTSGGETILWSDAASPSTAVTSNAAGSTLTVVYSGTAWVVVAQLGTWTGD